MVTGTKRAATASLRNRPQAGNAASNRDADGPLTLAVKAHTVRRQPRALATRESRHDLQQLLFVDRTTAEFEIDPDVI